MALTLSISHFRFQPLFFGMPSCTDILLKSVFQNSLLYRQTDQTASEFFQNIVLVFTEAYPIFSMLPLQLKFQKLTEY